MSEQPKRLTDEQLQAIQRRFLVLFGTPCPKEQMGTDAVSLLAHIDALNADLAWERAKNKHLLWALKWDE